MMTFEPKGYRVLIKPDKVEEVTQGGIIIAKETRDKEQHGTDMGEVLAIGEQCWTDVGNKEPWCKAGLQTDNS